MTRLQNKPTDWNWRVPSIDLGRAAALAIITILLWCTLYNRWTAESWQTPLDYLSDPQKGDVFENFAWIKAAGDGHMSPFFYSFIPELGAPHVANWDDFPLPEKPLLILTGWLAHAIGLFAAANMAVLLGQVLAALSFFAACRLLNGSWIWSFAGALVFAFSRYAFSHGLHHLEVLYYWHLPLCLVVCEWLFRGDGMKLGERRFVFALIVAFVTGIQHIYYTFIFVQLVFFGGLVQGWRRGWRHAIPAAAIIGVSAAGCLLMDLNTVFHDVAYGGNSGAVVRDYHWLEVYGLKLVDLAVPPPDHAFPPFAAWGAQHLKEIVLSPGEMPPSGYVGLVGLSAMAWLVFASVRRAIDRSTLPLESFFILWIILLASVGGINGVVGTLGFYMFRATTRFSILILCIVLIYAVRQLSLVKFKGNWPAYVLAVLVVLIAYWDQTPPMVTDKDIAEVASEVASDRHFTENMEQRLSPGAMVLELPLMDFPESPAPGVGAYDHFRPYLFARDLRFSFGSDKGRPEGDWQHQLANLPLGVIVSDIQSNGFAAIYLNRGGLFNKGESLIKGLKALGCSDTLESERGDLVCIFLKKQ